ncbi:MAG: HEAT repeat domain-containing protein [Planctomycetaceae bacterium]|jgi:HEAT repeat protein|nr:HEAT repeat domain-containing protein [Planctomycetaceae bacterium]
MKMNMNMKMKLIFSAAVVVSMAVIFSGINLIASEIEDKFNELLPNIGAVDLSARAQAQGEWQAICLKNSNDPAKRAEAVKLMTIQLKKKDVTGETAIAFLSLLGLIGDKSTVPTLEEFLGNREIRFVDESFAAQGRVLVVDEAVRALARIPDKESAIALSSTNSIYARSGQIAHAKKLNVKIGVETKMPLAIPYADQKDVDQYVSNFASQSDVVKTQIVVNLGVRGDGKYSDLIKQSIKSENKELRQAAIAAIVKLNSGDIVETLIELLLGNDDTSVRAAAGSLSVFTSNQVDEKLVELAKTETDGKRFHWISAVLTNRKTSAFLPVILDRLKSNTAPDRKAAIARAAAIATAKNIADFVDLWLVISDRAECADVEKTIAKFANGNADVVLVKQTAANKTKMYSLLGRIGDPKTLPEFRTALAATSAEAFGGIREWPDATVAGDLLAIVQGKLGSYSNDEKINALRSYIRVISLPQDKLKIKATVEEQADFLISAFAAATRDEERNLVIQRLGAVRHVKSLNFVVGRVDNEKLSRTAFGAILDLAHHAALRRKDADTFKAALKLVIEKGKERSLVERANSYLNNF